MICTSSLNVFTGMLNLFNRPRKWIRNTFILVYRVMSPLTSKTKLWWVLDILTTWVHPLWEYINIYRHEATASLIPWIKKTNIVQMLFTTVLQLVRQTAAHHFDFKKQLLHSTHSSLPPDRLNKAKPTLLRQHGWLLGGTEKQWLTF